MTSQSHDMAGYTVWFRGRNHGENRWGFNLTIFGDETAPFGPPTFTMGFEDGHEEEEVRLFLENMNDYLSRHRAAVEERSSAREVERKDQR